MSQTKKDNNVDITQEVSKETNNLVRMSGAIVGEPQFSHTIMGENFYKVPFEVYRSSGQSDTLMLMVSDRAVRIDTLTSDGSQMVSIIGQVRSYNRHESNRNRLELFVFALEIDAVGEDYKREDDVNQVEIHGYICKDTNYRKTPLGREITDMLVAVNRPYGKSDYIPCICWGRNARFADNLKIGDAITLTGRFQSREYTKVNPETEEAQTFTAYELSVSRIEYDTEC